MGGDQGTPQTSHLLPSARAELDRYLAAVERRMKEAGTYSQDAIEDLRAHVYAELAGVSPADEVAVKSVIRRLGAPEDVAAATATEPGTIQAPKTPRKITLVLVLLAPFAIASFVLFPYWMSWQTGRHPPSAPEYPSASEYPSAPGPVGISEGATLWHSRIFYQEQFANISDVRFAELDGEPGKELGVVGDRRALFFRLDGSLKSKVYFDDAIYSPRFVDVDFDGHAEFLAPGGAFQKVVLLNDLGHVVWSRPDASDPPKTLPPDDTAAGDVDGDGKAEFAMATSDHVDLLDASGHLRWRRKSLGATKVFIVDLEGSDKRGILHNQMFEGLKVRDKNGDVIATANVGSSTPFTPVAWPNARGGPRVLVAENNRLRILTYEGTAVAELAVPGLQVGRTASDPNLWASYVRLSPEHPNVLMVLLGFGLTRSSLLVGFEGQTRIYREVISDSCSAMATAAEGTNEQDDLFVACREKVIEYKAAR
jgi:hypothetical protein